MSNALPVWRSVGARAAPGLFPPELIVEVKAFACELPSTYGVPLSRWSTRDLAAAVIQSGCVASISGTTIWRWLNEDAVRPWQHRCWIFPRDPHFAEKAGRILDPYESIWCGHRLKDDEFVLSTDEKTSIQARRRRHSSLPPQAGSPMRVEHEYKRCGAWEYLAVMDVYRAKLFGRCERRSGIHPFDRLVDHGMTGAVSPKSKKSECASPLLGSPIGFWRYGPHPLGAGVKAPGGRPTQISTSYFLGYPTLQKDEAGKKRQMWTDALGRVIEVDEPDPATGSLTAGSYAGTYYTYDLLDNRLQIVQQGSQTRTFAYDWLSRMTSSTTPEAGASTSGIIDFYYTTSGGALCTRDSRKNVDTHYF